jgi:ligand-binding sensor domain-containing protein
MVVVGTLGWVMTQGAELPPLPTETATRVTSFVTDAGLSGKNLFNIDFERAPGEARHGTVWIATSDGLVRYDGYRWERFGTQHGLPSDFVRCVHVGRDGRLWVGTDRGAGVFDGATFGGAQRPTHR